MTQIVEFIYKWPDGREEVRYRRPLGSLDADLYIKEIYRHRLMCESYGQVSPYSFRYAPIIPPKEEPPQ